MGNSASDISKTLPSSPTINYTISPTNTTTTTPTQNCSTKITNTTAKHHSTSTTRITPTTTQAQHSTGLIRATTATTSTAQAQHSTGLIRATTATTSTTQTRHSSRLIRAATATTNTAQTRHSTRASTVHCSTSFTNGSQGSSSTSPSQGQPETPRPASQQLKNSVNNYVIPAAASKEPQSITPCQDRSYAKIRVCPQYNGRGCVSEPCRRLHICFYWATKTCNRTPCKRDHSLDSVHNARLLEACTGRQNFRDHKVSQILETQLGPSSNMKEPQICLFNVFKRCTKEPCPRVHSAKNYQWQVKDFNGWTQLSFSQSDYLELMYSHPSEECVALIHLQSSLPNNRNMSRLASLLSKETSWSVDLEAMKLKGASSVHDIRRLSTASDLTSNVPVAMRWLWYWQGDDGCWEPYGEGIISGSYYVALSDYLEYLLQICNNRFVPFKVGKHHYTIDSKKMTQSNIATSKIRRVRRRPACSLVSQGSVRFDKLFLPLPTTREFLKLPVLPLSSEFIFVENLLKETLVGVRVAGMHRIQNDYLWKAYQTKKCLLTSLYNGDITATNEQYLFHGTRHEVTDIICKENLDWKLSGANVGHLYGHGTYFSNLALTAHLYAKDDWTGKRVMLVALVLVGKMTMGHNDTTFPPMNAAAGRAYDTTCDSKTNATIFVKYQRDEYYPAYVVRYSCDQL